MESSPAAAALPGGGSITINGTSIITHVGGVDRQRGQDENRAATGDPSPEAWHRSLPVLRNAARQDLAREMFTPPDSALIDIHDDYGGNWFSRTRDVRTGYILVLGSRPQKGLYIDIRV